MIGVGTVGSKIATDLHARESLVLRAGPLKPAVAASMAIPGLVQPLDVNGRVLVDGGVTDPLPFTCLRETADLIVAVDVSGGIEEQTAAEAVRAGANVLVVGTGVFGHPQGPAQAVRNLRALFAS